MDEACPTSGLRLGQGSLDLTTLMKSHLSLLILLLRATLILSQLKGRLLILSFITLLIYLPS